VNLFAARLRWFPWTLPERYRIAAWTLGWALLAVAWFLDLVIITRWHDFLALMDERGQSTLQVALGGIQWHLFPAGLIYLGRKGRV